MRDMVEPGGIAIGDTRPALVLQALYNQAQAHQPFAKGKTITEAQAERILAAQKEHHILLGKMLAVRFEPGKVVFLTDHSREPGTAYHDYNGKQTADIALAQAASKQREAAVGKPAGFDPKLLSNPQAVRPAAFVGPRPVIFGVPEK